jgi:single-strand DNA-binding protein
MEITGRLVADATVRATNSEKDVTGFRVAISRTYVSQGQQYEETTFINCAYWRSTAIAPYLTKGMLVHLSGFMSAHAYLNGAGEPQAELDFRVSEISLLTASRRPEEKPQAQEPAKTGSRNVRVKGRPVNKPNAGLQPSSQFN